MIFWKIISINCGRCLAYTPYSEVEIKKNSSNIEVLSICCLDNIVKLKGIKPLTIHITCRSVRPNIIRSLEIPISVIEKLLELKKTIKYKKYP
jgi:hypothetical protein